MHLFNKLFRKDRYCPECKKLFDQKSGLNRHNSLTYAHKGKSYEDKRSLHKN